MMKNKNKKFILWFEKIGIEDVGLVGGKNASLGEMIQNLTPLGVRVPPGFAVTAEAYFYFLKSTGLFNKLKKILADLNIKDVNDLSKKAKAVRLEILNTSLPKDLEVEIKENYLKLCQRLKNENLEVAIRSSATAEDLPTASFAGAHETYLNISGVHNVIEAVKRCFASLFTDRAISYLVDKVFDLFKVGLSVGIQKMVRADLGSSGVMFTLDTESGFKNVIYLTSIWGLGETIVQGRVEPDEFYIFKPTLKQGYKPIIYKKIGSKDKKTVYSRHGLKTTKEVSVDLKDRHIFSLANDDILTLAKWGILIEEHYSKKQKRWMPMDIEWAKDGQTQELFIVQSRPETIQAGKDFQTYEIYKLKSKGRLLLKGLAVGEKITSGRLRLIKDASGINEFQAGEILVTQMTDPDWEPIMKIAAGIITNEGGRTSHAAIVSRELGVPAIVGADKATQILKTGQLITIDCSTGSEGLIYEGALKWEKEKISLAHLPQTKTKVMLNIGEPDSAFVYSHLPVDGVGLARIEFVAASVKIHPLALVNFKNLKNEKLKEKIEELTAGYLDKKEFFVEKLAQGLGRIAAAFWPKEVIMRFSDFKTNEYRTLIGGELFEPEEANPMLGWRGASRYYHPRYRPAFELELKAVKKIREEYGLKNLNVMVPFCRTPEEGKKVIKIIEDSGLKSDKDFKRLKIFVMCEIPSNVILAEEFLKIFDGFSIGSNDLTQLTLGIDRDNAALINIADERQEAVKKLLAQAIKIAKAQNKYVGICGQAPSDFPEIVEFLVKVGIDSISLNPDTVIKTKINIAKIEKKIKNG